MRYLLLTCFFVLLLMAAGAQVEVNDQCKAAYQDILSLKFDAAQAKLALEKKSGYDNLYVPYLENYIDFLSVFISEDENILNGLADNKSDRIDRIKRMDDSSAFKKYMLGNINLQWAVARLKFQEYFSAALEINRAYRLLKSNAEEFPDFVPNNISLGVLHIMIGMVPKNYHWLLNLINMEGSVDQGRKELFHVLQKANEEEAYSYLKNETLFYLGFVELNITPDTASLNEIQKQLAQADPSVLLLTFLNISIQMRTGHNEKALEIFNLIPEEEAYFPFFYLSYLKAECQLRKLETADAEIGYDQFLENFKGKNYIKDAWRKKAWISLLDGDTVQYKKNMVSAFGFGSTDVGQDKDAKREATEKTIPNLDLIKSRLLFDGGYYVKTDSVLFQIDTNVLLQDQKIEWEYRLARSAHEQFNMSEAKEYYEKTIANGSQSKRYFAGNSALKLGEIYEQENEVSKAIFYYSICLELDFDEFQNGIQSKAKAGLKRLSR